MAWKFELVGDAGAVNTALQSLAVTTANPFEDAQVATIIGLIGGKLPVSGNIVVRASGQADAVSIYVTAQVKPVEILK